MLAREGTYILYVSGLELSNVQYQTLRMQTTILDEFLWKALQTGSLGQKRNLYVFFDTLIFVASFVHCYFTQSNHGKQPSMA